MQSTPKSTPQKNSGRAILKRSAGPSTAPCKRLGRSWKFSTPQLVGELKKKFGDWDKQKPKDKQQDERPPFSIPPATQNYFTVYDLNAGMLGRITKAELTKKIVTTYARAKSLMDAANCYAPRYEERDRLSRGTGPEPTQAQGMDPGLRKCANETIRE